MPHPTLPPVSPPPAARPRPLPDADAAPAPGWALQLGQRIRHHVVLKTVGITGFMWLFFVAYFYLLRNPARPVTVMPLTWLDHAMPVQPGALVAYVSLWFYVGIPPGLMVSLRDAAVYGLWVGALCLTGLAVFWLWPTAVPPAAIPPELMQHPVYALMQGVDAAGNACPSLHVATAAFSAAWVHRLLLAVGAPAAMRVANAVWLLAIVHSTMAVRQHVALDVAAGAVLAAVFAAASLRWRPDSLRPGAVPPRR